eukprot:TRINITY_DN37103_c0_g1_i1.p1 TRINITY_DN37103_c0_g1~~TRINITY_DN37103_c0_g1_i1.p1  ORF type:complete len:426 (+),score=63.80 TRINITY_DN37103_c0_g1_i1:97-1278(+)
MALGTPKLADRSRSQQEVQILTPSASASFAHFCANGPSAWLGITTLTSYVLMSNLQPLEELMLMRGVVQRGFIAIGRSKRSVGMKNMLQTTSLQARWRGLWKKPHAFVQCLNQQELQELSDAVELYEYTTSLRTPTKPDLMSPSAIAIFKKFGITVITREEYFKAADNMRTSSSYTMRSFTLSTMDKLSLDEEADATGNTGSQVARTRNEDDPKSMVLGLVSSGFRPRVVNTKAALRAARLTFDSDAHIGYIGSWRTSVIPVLRPGWLLVDFASVLVHVLFAAGVSVSPLALYVLFLLAEEPYRSGSPFQKFSRADLEERTFGLTRKLFAENPYITAPCGLSFLLLVCSAVYSYWAEAPPVTPLQIMYAALRSARDGGGGFGNAGSTGASPHC